MVKSQFKILCINTNAQHVNGMTPFDLAEQRGRLVKYISVNMYGY